MLRFDHHFSYVCMYVCMYGCACVCLIMYNIQAFAYVICSICAKEALTSKALMINNISHYSLFVIKLGERHCNTSN